MEGAKRGGRIDTDSILRRQLGIIGYPGADQMGLLGEMSSVEYATVVEFVLSKIEGVDPGSKEIPKGGPAHHKHIESMIGRIQRLGYRDAVNPTHFLSPKSSESRSILSFVLSKVQTGSSAGKKSVALKPMEAAIQEAQSAFVEAGKEPGFGLGEWHFLTGREKLEREDRERRMFCRIPMIRGGIFGIPFRKEAISTLLSENDRETSLNGLVGGHAVAPRLQSIAIRAFAEGEIGGEDLTVSLKTGAGSGAPIGSGVAKSRIVNMARFEHGGGGDMKMGNSAMAVPMAAGGSMKKMKKSSSVMEEVGVVEETGEKEEGEKMEERKYTREEVMEIRRRNQEEQQERQEELGEMERKNQEMEEVIEEKREELREIHGAIGILEQERKKLVPEVREARRLVEASTADRSEIKGLQQKLVNTTSRILEVAEEYEERRGPLIQRYRNLAKAVHMEKQKRENDAIKVEKIKRQLVEVEKKIQTDSQRIEEFEEALGDTEGLEPRSVYINAIMDIIRTVEKQESVVEKIRSDIREQHQQFGKTVGTVKRTWTLLNDTIYTEAKKKDSWARGVYKKVVELLTLYESISVDVEERGKISAQIMELETKIFQMKQQIDVGAVERLEEELASIKEEIRRLE